MCVCTMIVILSLAYFLCIQYYDIDINITKKSNDPIEKLIGVKINDSMEDAHKKLGYPSNTDQKNGRTILYYLYYFKDQKRVFDIFPRLELEFTSDNRLVEVNSSTTWDTSGDILNLGRYTGEEKVIKAVNSFILVDEQLKEYLGQGKYSATGKKYDSTDQLYERLLNHETEIEYKYTIKYDESSTIVKLSLRGDDKPDELVLALNIESLYI